MEEHYKIVVFSGAGMSAESGIATFRDTGGLWENYRIEEVATPDAWNANPEKVQHFYNLRRQNIRESEPNEAHFEIAGLESDYAITVITQNIDDLHERAGSSNVLHLHGNIMQAKSSGPKREDKYYPVEDSLDVSRDFCDDGYPLRPHVVWFGEDVPNYEKALSIIREASVLIVIGTSLNVYPAAGLIHYTPVDCRCFLIDPNVEELNVPGHFTLVKTGAVEGMKKVVELMKKKRV